mgnify:FL=1
METYLKIYRWSMRMKLRMGVYTVALLFFKIIWNWINGIFSVQSMDILTIWGVCLLFAMLETVILPEGKDPTVLRTVIWIVAANIIFCGGAVLAGWFSGIPVWGTVGLVLFLELAIALMWFGDNVAMRADSVRLNRQLRQFQQQHQGKE